MVVELLDVKGLVVPNLFEFPLLLLKLGKNNGLVILLLYLLIYEWVVNDALELLLGLFFYVQILILSFLIPLHAHLNSLSPKS